MSTSNTFRGEDPAVVVKTQPIYPRSFPALLPINGYQYVDNVKDKDCDIADSTQWRGVQESCMRFLSLLDIVQMLYLRRKRLDYLGNAWHTIPEAMTFSNVNDLEEDVNNVLEAIELKARDKSLPMPLMVQAWLHGGGVMRVTKTPSPRETVKALAVVRVKKPVNVVSSLESWLDHRVFNCRSASPSQYLLTLPGEFMINHYSGVGLTVKTSGLVSATGYTLTLGPSLSGRYAKYGLVMGIAQAKLHMGSTFPFVTSRHFEKERRAEPAPSEIEVYHCDGGLINDSSFQLCLLMFTLWRKVEESASVASPDAPVVQRRSRSTAPQVPAAAVRRSPDRVVPAAAVLDSIQAVVYQFSSTQDIAQQFADELTSAASSEFNLRSTVLALPPITDPPPAPTQSYSFSILLHRWTTRVDLNEVYQQLVWVKAAHPEAQPLLVSMNRSGVPFPLRVTELHTGDVSEKIQQLVGRVYDVGFSQGQLTSKDFARDLVQVMRSVLVRRSPPNSEDVARKLVQRMSNAVHTTTASVHVAICSIFTDNAKVEYFTELLSDTIDTRTIKLRTTVWDLKSTAPLVDFCLVLCCYDLNLEVYRPPEWLDGYLRKIHNAYASTHVVLVVERGVEIPEEAKQWFAAIFYVEHIREEVKISTQDMQDIGRRIDAVKVSY